MTEQFFCALDSTCFALVDGVDADRFLHAQFTNDLLALDNAHSQLAAYCNAKGRIFAVLRIQRYGAGLLLQLPCEIADDTLSQLQRYILRAKVTMKINPEIHAIGVSGDAAELENILGTLPGSADELVRHSDLLYVRMPSENGVRLQILGPQSSMDTMQKELSSTLRKEHESEWLRQEILAGMPRILSATRESFVPQMVNLDLLGAISFSKGCYPGQEIVARMRYLGKLKQRMRLLHVPAIGELAPKPGDKIVSASSNVGTVVDAQPDDQGGFDMLAVLLLDIPAGAELSLGSQDGPRLTLAQLPYPLISDQQRQA